MKMIDYAKYSLIQTRKNLDDTSNLKLFIEKVTALNPVRMIFVASGSSYNGALVALANYETLSATPISIKTPENIIKNENVNVRNAYVLISQSGESTNMLDCLEFLKAHNIPALALTGNEKSSLAKACTNSYYYGSGFESVGFVTMGVQTLIEFLNFAMLSLYGTNEEIEQFHKGIEFLYKENKLLSKQTEQFIKDNFLLLSQKNPTIFCGDVENFGVAKEASLKWEETLKRPAMYYEVEEFLHGPDFQLTPNHTVFLLDDFEPNKRIEQIFKQLQSVSSQIYVVSSNPQLTGEKVLHLPKSLNRHIDSMEKLFPFQFIAAYLSDKLDTWDKHPYFEKVNQSIEIKTELYRSNLSKFAESWDKEESND